jgi:sulfate-transporting ATPase
MSGVLQFALLGLGAGAAYALLGQGLVLIHRGSGILNLAHGAFAMAGAFLFHELHTNHGHGTVESIVISVLVMAAVGAALDQTFLRRLRHGSALARLIATLGFFMVLQAIGILRYGSGATLAQPLFTPNPVHLLGTIVPADRLWLLGIAIAVTLALMAMWRFTRIGWVMAAVSENQLGAAALGWSPERISALTWAIGAGLAALAGILIAPIAELAVTNLSFIVIPALAAALVGGFCSYGWTLVGGLALGIAQSLTTRYVNVTGGADALPFFIIVVLLFVRGTTLPQRGHVADRLPTVGTGIVRPQVALGTLAVAAVVIGVALSPNGLAATMVCLSVATILLSIVVVTGYAGQLSLAQFAVAGIGALVAARLVQSQGWAFPLALVAGVLGGAIVGLVLALPALRTRGIELAVVTLGLGVAVQALVFNSATLTGSVTGTPVGSPSMFGLGLDAGAHPVRYALFTLCGFGFAALVVANVRRGRAGRQMLAVRTNERGAAALGISVAQTKLYAFTIGGALAGLGGIMLAFQTSTVVYDGFDPITSITAVAQAVIGGVGYIAGPLVGATLAPGSIGEAITSGGTGGGKYLPLIAGCALLALLMIDPNGLVPFVRKLAARIVRRPQRAPAFALQPEVAASVVPALTLDVHDLHVRYGGVVAVDALSFRVAPGEVVGLIGPNGAGKTSVIDAISGFARGDGEIALGEQRIDGWAPHRRAKAGLVRSFQSLELFEDMTVMENLQAAGDSRARRTILADAIVPHSPPLSPSAIAAVREFGLEDSLQLRCGELSYGRRRLLAIARALAMEPSILLLDEPVAGLDEAESREFARLVRLLAEERGIGVLVVEHDMSFVMGICDRIHVINFGRPIAAGSPDAVRADEAAITAYLGGEEPERVFVAAGEGASR